MRGCTVGSGVVRSTKQPAVVQPPHAPQLPGLGLSQDWWSRESLVLLLQSHAGPCDVRFHFLFRPIFLFLAVQFLLGGFVFLSGGRPDKQNVNTILQIRENVTFSPLVLNMIQQHDSSEINIGKRSDISKKRKIALYRTSSKI